MYCHGNPINFNDPDGHAQVDVVDKQGRERYGNSNLQKGNESQPIDHGSPVSGEDLNRVIRPISEEKNGEKGLMTSPMKKGREVTTNNGPQKKDHPANDYGLSRGTKLKAIFGGKAKVHIPSQANMGTGGGVMLSVTSGNITAFYMHLDNSQESINYLSSIDGKDVEFGDIVAFSGNTGNTSGPHLDLRIREVLEASTFNYLKAYAGIKNSQGMYMMENGKPVFYHDPCNFLPENKERRRRK